VNYGIKEWLRCEGVITIKGTAAEHMSSLIKPFNTVVPPWWWLLSHYSLPGQVLIV